MRSFLIAAAHAMTSLGGGPPAAAPAGDAAPPAARTPAAAPSEPRVVRPFDHLVVRIDERVVEIAGHACLDVGWLEQIVCTPGTREHEALVVTEARPSDVHAALLMAGFEPGRPGRWEPTETGYRGVPPTGTELSIRMRWTDPGTGERREVPVRDWIRDHHGRRAFPETPWIFGGSRFVEIPPALRSEGDPAEMYAADGSGSVIGLVTFGDEVIGYSKVLADQVELEPAEWEVDTEAVPPIGTPVTVVVRRRDTGGG